MANREGNVVLVSLPWTTLIQPSLALGILQARLMSDHIPSRAYYASLDLLKYLTYETYHTAADCWGINDFLFTAVLDNAVDEKQLQTLQALCVVFAKRQLHKRYQQAEDLFELFLAMRDRVIPQYIAECADRILAMEPTMVGFTCMFDQTIASAAVAKLLKESCPGITTVLGGYAVQHDNGLEVLKAFPQIDCICRGDGEPVISRLARASVGAEPLSAIPGVLTRKPQTAVLPVLSDKPAPKAKADLRAAQAPDYSDWYADLSRIEKEHRVSVDTRGLPIEASRGCWWGQKQHCTFCGIDEETLSYRSKSAEQVVNEIRELRRRHPDNYLFRFVDYIFPHYLHCTLLPQLSAFEPRVWLEAEIKANQTEDKIRNFAEAGFRALQPGIESFSSQVLASMDKGVRGVHNVQLLKWGYLNKIVLHYNLLYGFPDDCVNDYRRLVENMPRLYHLMPPISRTEVIITRFAPLQADPARFGMREAPVHHECYDVLFSSEFLEQTGFKLDNYCYYFKRHFQYAPVLNELYGQLVIQVNHWKEQHKVRDVYLSYRRNNGNHHFEDSRFGQPVKMKLSGLLSNVYHLCDSAAVSQHTLAQKLGFTTENERAELSGAIQELDSMRLIWREDDTIFGLGIPADSTHSVLDRHWRACWGGLYE